MHYFDSSADMSVSSAYLQAIGVIASSALFVLIDHLYNFECYNAEMQIRTACSSLLYRKVKMSTDFVWIRPCFLNILYHFTVFAA